MSCNSKSKAGGELAQSTVTYSVNGIQAVVPEFVPKPTPRGEFEEETADIMGDLYIHAARKHNYYKNVNGEDSFEVSARILGELFPEGVKRNDYRRFIEVWEVVRKLCVIANDGVRKDDDTSVWSDVAGWAVRAMVDDNLRRKRINIRDVR